MPADDSTLFSPPVSSANPGELTGPAAAPVPAGADPASDQRPAAAVHTRFSQPLKKTLQVLHLEKSRHDSERAREALFEGGIFCEIVRVDNRTDFQTALQECEFDFVLANYFDRMLDGFSALKLVKEKNPELPVLFVCEPIGEKLLEELLLQGAAAVIGKDQLQSLAGAVRNQQEQTHHRVRQKQAEAALNESEEHFRQIAENLRQAFWMANVEGTRMLYVSPAFEEMWGRPDAAFFREPHNFLTTIHPEDRPRVEQTLERKNHQEEFQIEFRIVRPDGAMRWIWNRGVPIRDAEGRLHHLVGMAEDITERKLAEEKLQRTTERFSAIFQSFPDLYFLLEGDGTIVDYHAGQVSDFSVRPEELPGRRIQDVLPPAVGHQFQEAFPRVQKTKALVTLEYTLAMADGENYYEARLLPLLETQIFVFVRNITERKRGEQALRESQRRIAHLIDALPGIVFSSANDAAWSMTYLSEGVFHLTGYKREELLRNSLVSYQSITHPEDAPKVMATIQTAIAAHQPYVVEYRIRTRSGQERWLWEKGRGVFDRDGEALGREGFITDITERKHAEAVLSEQSSLLRGVAAATNHLLTDTDYDSAIHKTLHTLGQAAGVDRVYIYENQPHPDTGEMVLRLWCEWTRESVMPSIVKSLLHSKTYSALGLNRWYEAFSQGQSIRGLVSTFPKAERELLVRDDIVSIILVPIIVDQNLWGYVGFDDCLLAHEWSSAEESILVATAASIGGALKSKRAKEALSESNQRLETALNEIKRTQQHIVQQERLHALGQMASGIAHDFNNALMAILGFGELLLMHPETLDNKEKVRGYVQTMNTAAKDAANVVKRLSEFYRHREYGEVFPPMILANVIKQVITLTQPKWKDQAQASGIAIDIKTDLPDVPLVAGHEAEFRECLTNLLLNAVDAMPSGGLITLRTRSEGDSVVVEVSDTGTGMSDDVRKRCLEPFFSTKGQRGTGLGLSMVFGIVQRHQGTIEIQTELGKGTTFLLRLPAQKLNEEEIRSTETDMLAVKPLQILVVDDEPLVREVLCEYLNNDGHTVVTANDGREGLQKFGDQSFDLVLTDKSMPHMSGDHLAAAIKQVAPEKPVVLLTGFGEMIKASGRKPPNIDIVMSKPVTLNSLRRMLAEAIAV